MSAEVDTYFAGLSKAQAAALTEVRHHLADRIAHAGIAVEEVMSYNMPGFRILSDHGRGKVLLGYAAWRDHLSVYPYSGAVLARMTSVTRGMSQTKSALHIAIGAHPDNTVIDRMISLRLEELG